MAGNKSATIQVILSAKDQNLISEMVKAEMAVQKFGEKTKEHAKGVMHLKDEMASLATAVKGFIGFEIATKAIEAFGEAFKKAQEYAKAGKESIDLFDRQAANLGTTSQAMAAFAVMEQRADLAAGSLTTGLVKMQEQIQASAKYGSEAQVAFERLNLRFSDFIGLKTEDQFRLISEAISKIDSASERTALTVGIFGKAGKDLIGTMGDGKAAFDDASAAAAKFGLALDDMAKAKILAADSKVKELELVVKGFQQQAAAANAANVAAEAVYAIDAEKRTAARAKEINEYGSWWTNFKALMFQDTNIKAGEKTTLQKMADAAKAVNDAGQKALDDQKANQDAMVKGYADFGAMIERLGAQREADLKLTAQIEAKQAEIAKAYHAERIADLKDFVQKYNGGLAAVNKIHDLMRESKAKFDKEFWKQADLNGPTGKTYWQLKEDEAWLKKDPTQDPELHYRIRVDQLRQQYQDTMTEQQIQDEAKREREEEARWANPNTDPRVVYEERVAALNRKQQLKEDADERTRATNKYRVQLSAASDFFGNLATLTDDAAKQSDAMFYINKALLMAQAEINAWMAYSNIMGNPTLGLSVGAPAQQAMAITALAAGQVAVGHIAASQPAGRANGGPVAAGQLYEVNERGPEVLSIGDRSFLMMGAKDGRVTPNAGTSPGKAPQITVNIHNAPGTTAQVQQGGTPEAPTLDVIIRAVDGAVAGAIRNGTTQTSRALGSVFGLNRARGAF